MQFSLIIPSYNNSGEIIAELPLLMQWFEQKKYVVEVIIVNDGSPQAEQLKPFCAQHHFTLLSHEVNRGKGAAVRTGMLAANNDIRIFTDADIPFQYDAFTMIVDAFRDTHVDVVAGDRRRSDYFSKTPAIRRMGSSIFSILVNIIMMKNLGDTQCGIKAFRKKAVDIVFPNAKITGFAADIEWLYTASTSKLETRWVNAEFRNAGESSVVFWKQAIKMLTDVMRLRMNS